MVILKPLRKMEEARYAMLGLYGKRDLKESQLLIGFKTYLPALHTALIG